MRVESKNFSRKERREQEPPPHPEEHQERQTEHVKRRDRRSTGRRDKEDQADAAELNRVREETLQASQILGKKIYEASAAEAGATADEREAAGDDVVEAEIVDEGEES